MFLIIIIIIIIIITIIIQLGHPRSKYVQHVDRCFLCLWRVISNYKAFHSAGFSCQEVSSKVNVIIQEKRL